MSTDHKKWSSTQRASEMTRINDAPEFPNDVDSQVRGQNSKATTRSQLYFYRLYFNLILQIHDTTSIHKL